MARALLYLQPNPLHRRMKPDTSAALYLAARAYAEAHPLKASDLFENSPPRYAWGRIVNRYDTERRTYVLEVDINTNGAPLRVNALVALTGLSVHIQCAASDMGATLQPGGGYLTTHEHGARLTFA